MVANNETLKDTNSAELELLAFLNKTGIFTEEEKEALAKSIVVIKSEKGEVLVKEGDICNKCYFVLKGLLRQYIIADGIEKTTQFYSEGQAVVFFTSYTNQVKSASYLSCIEDSILIVGDPDSEVETYRKYPKLEQMTKMMMAKDLGKAQDDMAYFMASSPEARYKNLLQNRPDLLQRVPQNQLAGYLGITPESLSRIRKRISKSLAA